MDWAMNNIFFENSTKRKWTMLERTFHFLETAAGKTSLHRVWKRDKMKNFSDDTMWDGDRFKPKQTSKALDFQFFIYSEEQDIWLFKLIDSFHSFIQF